MIRVLRISAEMAHLDVGCVMDSMPQRNRWAHLISVSFLFFFLMKIWRFSGRTAFSRRRLCVFYLSRTKEETRRGKCSVAWKSVKSELGRKGVNHRPCSFNSSWWAQLFSARLQLRSTEQTKPINLSGNKYQLAKDYRWCHSFTWFRDLMIMHIVYSRIRSLLSLIPLPILLLNNPHPALQNLVRRLILHCFNDRCVPSSYTSCRIPVLEQVLLKTQCLCSLSLFEGISACSRVFLCGSVSSELFFTN